MTQSIDLNIDFSPVSRTFGLTLYVNGTPTVNAKLYKTLAESLDSLFGFTDAMMRIQYDLSGDPVCLLVDAR